MARVPLIQEQDHPEFADMIEKFRAGRRGKLINIYRMLLNAPPLAESWFNHSNTVRWKTTLPGRLREIVIIRMGHLANSQYVLRQHVPSLALADGLSLEECDALADWRASKCFSASDRAVLAYADTMTRDIAVPGAVFADVVLDPNTSPERTAAYADFFAHDEPDFDGYCKRVRACVGKVFPREVRLVETQAA